MKHISKILIIVSIITSSFGCNNIDRKIDLLKNQKHIKFIEANPSSLESAHALAIMSTTFGKHKTLELYNKLSTKVKGSPEGEIIKRYLSINRDPDIGEYFVDFEMKTPSDETIKLSDLKGKVILLEFWASWCGPCQREMPNIKKIYEEFHNDGLEILAVSLDFDKNSWTKAINDRNLNWYNVSELESHYNTACFIYGVHGIPDNFLIDKNGIIIARGLRGDKLRKKVKKIMSGTNKK